MKPVILDRDTAGGALERCFAHYSGGCRCAAIPGFGRWSVRTHDGARQEIGRENITTPGENERFGEFGDVDRRRPLERSPLVDSNWICSNRTSRCTPFKA
jgi:hypothetical protein